MSDGSNLRRCCVASAIIAAWLDARRSSAWASAVPDWRLPSAWRGARSAGRRALDVVVYLFGQIAIQVSMDDSLYNEYFDEAADRAKPRYWSGGAACWSRGIAAAVRWRLRWYWRESRCWRRSCSGYSFARNRSGVSLALCWAWSSAVRRVGAQQFGRDQRRPVPGRRHWSAMPAKRQPPGMPWDALRRCARVSSRCRFPSISRLGDRAAASARAIARWRTECGATLHRGGGGRSFVLLALAHSQPTRRVAGGAAGVMAVRAWRGSSACPIAGGLTFWSVGMCIGTMAQTAGAAVSVAVKGAVPPLLYSVRRDRAP
jgi:hypothetical protein